MSMVSISGGNRKRKRHEEKSKFKSKTFRKGNPKKLDKVYRQSGNRKNIKRDREILARKPGWRTSRSGGYFENRRNRSDKDIDSRI